MSAFSIAVLHTLCSSQPHTEIARLTHCPPHTPFRFFPPPAPYGVLVSRILKSLGSESQGPMMLQSSLPHRDSLTPAREPRVTLASHAHSPHAPGDSPWPSPSSWCSRLEAQSFLKSIVLPSFLLAFQLSVCFLTSSLFLIHWVISLIFII